MMLGTGIQLTLLAGRTVPVPAPGLLMEALESVEVSRSANSRSGFQLIFDVGSTSGTKGAALKLAAKQLLAAFNRLILMVTLGGRPSVLIDGIITNRQLQPGEQPGQSRLTITGEDIAMVMGREEKARTHPAQDMTAIVAKLIGEYARYGMVPAVIPPIYLDAPNPVERIPTQQGTDLAYIEKLAEEVGHVFCVMPGPAPGSSVAYWGPPGMSKPPQPALSVNLGMHTNVESLDFENDSTQPAIVVAEIIEPLTNTQVSVPILSSVRTALSGNPPWEIGGEMLATRKINLSGATLTQALSRAQGVVDGSMDGVVKASGALDVARYGRVLEPNGVVGVRGAGHGYDGLYFVANVTHKIKRGAYKQDFKLTREGLGSSVETVPV
jgi:hypothetical protein